MEENNDPFYQYFKNQLDQEMNESIIKNNNFINEGVNNLIKQINSEVDEDSKNFEKKWNNRFTEQNSKIQEMSSRNIKNFDNYSKNNSLNKNKNVFEENYHQYGNKGGYNDKDNFDILDNVEEMEFSVGLMKESLKNMKELKEPTFTGIRDNGELNGLLVPILYCFSQNESFLNFFIENGTKIAGNFNKNKKMLSPLLLNLVNNLWKEDGNRLFSPLKIKEFFSNENLNNPRDIINYLFNKINEEILGWDNEVFKINVGDPYDYFSPEVMLKNFQDSFEKYYYIYLSKHFFGYCQVNKKCDCDVDCFSFEPFVAINLYLDSEIFGNFNGHDMNEFTKLDLEKNLSNLIIKNGEKIKERCLICEDQKNMSIKRQIVATKENLIFTIDRTKDKRNIMSLCYKEMINIDENKYQLNAIIKKKNENYYWSYFKSFINQKWYCQNREKIYQINNNENELFDFKNSCVLFYKKIK